MEYCSTIPKTEGIGVLVQNIILFSVLIYELVGPFLTKIALTKAGEIDKEGKVSERNNIKIELKDYSKKSTPLKWCFESKQ